MEELTNGNQDHEAWEINSIFIYNILEYLTLSWPSLTCQWLPEKEIVDDCDVYKLMLGTHAETDENKLILMDVKFKKNNNSETDEPNSGFPCVAQFKESKSYNHSGDVNRARFMPQNSSIICSRSSDCNTYLYGREGKIMTLSEHSEEGYGMSWNQLQEGHLLTASFDKTVKLWDTNSSESKINALRSFKAHNDKVEDVSWHPNNSNEFASVGDDGMLFIYDLRQSAGEGVSLKTEVHSKDANCVNWHPVTHNLLATGGSDGMVQLLDRRHLNKELHSFPMNIPVYRVEWSPTQETVLVACGLGNAVVLWDLARIGDDVMSAVEEESANPEAILTHLAHSDALSDVAWLPHQPWTLASVSEDNILNVWQLNDHILDDE